MSYQQGNFTFYAKVSVGYLAPLYQSQCLEFNNSSWGTKAAFSSLSPSRKKMSKYFSPEVNSFWYCCSCCQRKYFNALVSAWTMDRSKQIHSLICVFFCFFDLDSFSVYLFPYVMTFGHAIRIFFIIVFLSGVQNKLVECIAIISRFLVSCRQQKNA